MYKDVGTIKDQQCVNESVKPNSSSSWGGHSTSFSMLSMLPC
jgi:hypothetical protein